MALTVGQLTPGSGLAVDADALLRRARASGQARAQVRARRCCSASRRASAPHVDPSAVVFASRAAGEDWFCFEQPDRGGSALAALGVVTRLTASGPDALQAGRGRLAGARPPARSPTRRTGRPAPGWSRSAASPFAPDGGHAPHWSGFAAADLVVPEVALARRGDDVRLTLAALAAPDDVPEELAARLAARAAALRLDPLPLLDPAPAGRFRIDSVAPPEHYEAAVARAVERIRAGRVREDRARPRGHGPGADAARRRRGLRRPARGLRLLLRLLRRPRRRRLRRRLARAAGPPRRRRAPRPWRSPAPPAAPPTPPSTTTSASSSALRQGPRGAGDRRPPDRPRAAPARRLGRRARRAALIKVANIQHLATPIRAQLAQPLSAIELAGLLHPTPAVGGEPHAAAAPLIPALEGLDRGWYAGAVGWTDANDDGEFCVALRCALLRGTEARLYAGVGVVRDSDPAAELDETEIKLGALLPVLAG